MKKTSLASALLLLISFATGANGDADRLIAEGDSLWVRQELGQAEARFRQAIAESPDSVRAYQQLAGVLMTQNKTREAIEAYQTAITLDPENPKLFVAIAIAYLHEQSFSAARAMGRQALQLDPGLKEASSLLEYMDARQREENVLPGEPIPGDPEAVSNNPAE